MPGPNGCNAAIIIKGEHFWCEEQPGRGYDKCDHGGWAHGNAEAETIWGYADIQLDDYPDKVQPNV